MLLPLEIGDKIRPQCPFSSREFTVVGGGRLKVRRFGDRRVETFSSVFKGTAESRLGFSCASRLGLSIFWAISIETESPYFEEDDNEFCAADAAEQKDTLSSSDVASSFDFWLGGVDG